MELFKKYEFNSKEQAETKIAGLPHITDDVTGESYLEANHTIVKLGYLWIEEPTFDAEGELLTEGVASDKYSVDVLWQDLESSPYGWASYEITVEGNGVHTFLGRNF
jgi:hypothetical protein